MMAPPVIPEEMPDTEGAQKEGMADEVYTGVSQASEIEILGLNGSFLILSDSDTLLEIQTSSAARRYQSCLLKNWKQRYLQPFARSTS